MLLGYASYCYRCGTVHGPKDPCPEPVIKETPKKSQPKKEVVYVLDIME